MYLFKTAVKHTGGLFRRLLLSALVSAMFRLKKSSPPGILPYGRGEGRSHLKTLAKQKETSKPKSLLLAGAVEQT